MSSKVLGLRTVIYRVADLAAAKTWYNKVLGLEPYFDQPFYVGFNVGGFELGLVPFEDSQTVRSADAAPGGVTAYWGVHNVQESFDRLLESGAVPHERPQNVGGQIVVATVIDPWGNPFGIIYNPDFKIQ